MKLLLPSHSYITTDVLLKDVVFTKGVADKNYIPWVPGTDLAGIKIGAPILTVSGHIENKNKKNKYIAMWGDGYNGRGTKVAGTIDAAHIAGQILVELEYNETGQFTLHLNWTDDLESVGLSAYGYSFPPP